MLLTQDLLKGFIRQLQLNSIPINDFDSLFFNDYQRKIAISREQNPSMAKFNRILSCWHLEEESTNQVSSNLVLLAFKLKLSRLDRLVADYNMSKFDKQLVEIREVYFANTLIFELKV